MILRCEWSYLCIFMLIDNAVMLIDNAQSIYTVFMYVV